MVQSPHSTQGPDRNHDTQKALSGALTVNKYKTLDEKKEKGTRKKTTKTNTAASDGTQKLTSASVEMDGTEAASNAMEIDDEGDDKQVENKMGSNLDVIGNDQKATNGGGGSTKSSSGGGGGAGVVSVDVGDATGNDNSRTAKNGGSESLSASNSGQGTSGDSAKHTSAAGGTNGSSGSGTAPGAGTAAAGAAAAAPAPPPPPPVLKGTLSYNLELRRHVIRGMWNYENSNTFPPQRFELVRTLQAEEDPKVIPKDGEFHGSFSLAYFHTTSKGKQKERSKVIPESGVKIKFQESAREDGEYDVDGQGNNQFGVFQIYGVATKSEVEGDPTYNVVLRKKYLPSQAPPAASTGSEHKKNKKNKKDNKRKHTNGTELEEDGEEKNEDGPLPPPSKSYPTMVVCLRGKLQREQSDDLGVSEVLHKITGLWSSGLDLVLADPENRRGLCNRFEYEHKSTLPNNTFPISGRYFGWFDLSGDDGTKTQMTERDVVLKFRKNNEGYYNVEGRGSNAFGKYNISGTLTNDNIITIFRHFQPRKTKTKDPAKAPVTAAPPPLNDPGKTEKAQVAPPIEPQLKLDDVPVPSGGPLAQTTQPLHGTYSAVSRGVLRVNDDGAHTCAGKWAMTREHFHNGQTSSFHFRLESHQAAESAKSNAGNESSSNADKETPAVSLSGAPSGAIPFPLDSALYKGSFQMKRGATKNTSVIDQQIVLKFRKNTTGTFNVYGKGVNTLGIFNLVGTLILSGKGSGHVELYRMYPIPKPEAPPGSAPPQPGKPVQNNAKPKLPTRENAAATSNSAPTPSVPVSTTIPRNQGGPRRGSSRLTKLPSKLEDDDPQAQLSRMMDKCAQTLKFIRDKDMANGAFFSEPVDPVAHGIPTYYQIVKEPMDLGTIQRKLISKDILSPEEFGRLVRLVFKNAIDFNVDPTHVVHQAARNLLTIFNQKFRDVERQVETIRKSVKLTDEEAVRLGDDDKNARKGATGKKRKNQEPMTQKRRWLEEAESMAASHATALSNLVAAAPPDVSQSVSVSRAEFALLLQMIQQLQGQVVQTYKLLANVSSDALEEPNQTAPTAVSAPPPQPSSSAPQSEPVVPPPPAVTKPQKKKEPKVEPVEEDKPLTLKEQEVLTETINSLDPDKLPGVIQIIRESANLNDDEEEIDLEIDQLDTVTQRKLQRYVLKHAKPPRKKVKPGPKKRTAPKKAEVAAKPPPAKKAKTSPPPQKPPDTGSFVIFTEIDDSDSEEETAKAKETAPKPRENFNLGDASFVQDDDDDDDDDDLGNDLGNRGLFANFSATDKSISNTTDNDKDDDGGWREARDEAEAAKAREAERKKREEKIRSEVEQQKNQRLADAAARSEEILAQRQEEEANAEKLREQKEREAADKKKKAKELARAELESVEQTVDLESQRDIMKQYENFGTELGDGASPSSDFGF